MQNANYRNEGAGRPSPRLFPLLAVNFVGTLGFSIVLPFLVFLVTRWGGNALVYGLMGATYSAFQLVGAPVLGRWSDRYGRRRILLLSQLGTLFSWVIFVVAFALPPTRLVEIESGWFGGFALTWPLVVLFAARALDGVTGGNVSVANAYVADLTEERHRSAAYGKMAVSANLGFILGPALAGLLGGTPWGELLPVLAALAISATAAALILFWLEDLPPCPAEAEPRQGDALRVLEPDHRPCRGTSSEEDHLPLRRLLRLPHLGLMFSIYFLVMAAFNIFYVAFPVFAAVDLSWSLREVGIFFSVLSLLMVVVQGPVLAWASRRTSERYLILGGGAVLAASFVPIASGTVVGMYAGASLLALGNGLMWPSLVSSLSQAVDAGHQGLVQGFAGSLGAVASILGLVTGGLLFDAIGPAAFYLSAGGVLLAAALALRLPAAEQTVAS